MLSLLLLLELLLTWSDVYDAIRLFTKAFTHIRFYLQLPWGIVARFQCKSHSNLSSQRFFSVLLLTPPLLGPFPSVSPKPQRRTRTVLTTNKTHPQACLMENAPNIGPRPEASPHTQGHKAVHSREVPRPREATMFPVSWHHALSSCALKQMDRWLWNRHDGQVAKGNW